jgi:hypothetical protein
LVLAIKFVATSHSSSGKLILCGKVDFFSEKLLYYLKQINFKKWVFTMESTMEVTQNQK